MISVADQQRRAAAGALGAAAAVNIEQHQYKAPSPASAAGKYFFALTFHIVLPVRSRREPFSYHNLIGHKISQVADQQYRAAQQEHREQRQQ